MVLSPSTQTSLELLLLIYSVFSLRHVVSQSECLCTDECLMAVDIGDPRRTTDYQSTPEDIKFCDHHMAKGIWYRFEGYKILESCIEMDHCNTHAPIWMEGTHPTADDPGPHQRKVCSADSETCCQWSDTILVKWCKNSTTEQPYYVYKLTPPPTCDSAYCTASISVETGGSCSEGCVWNDITSECSCEPEEETPTGGSCSDGCVMNNIISECSCPATPGMSAPFLGEPYISDSKSVQDTYGNSFTATKFSIKCTAGYQPRETDDGARFDVNFEVDGSVVYSTTTTSLNPEAQLDEMYLYKDGNLLGKNLCCRVTSYWESDNPPHSEPLASDLYWLGVRPVDDQGSALTNIVVEEGQSFQFWMESTFPITTAWCFDVPEGTPCDPNYIFYISANEKLFFQHCAFQLNSEGTKSEPIVISPVPTISKTSSPIQWHLDFELNIDSKPSPDQKSLFYGYKIDSINVEIIDSTERPMCQSVGDPHIRIFPSAMTGYDFYAEGDYYLVKSISREFQIQARQFTCSGHASCNCAVCVREGNNIIAVDACPLPDEPSTTSWTPRIIRILTDKQYPGGTIDTTASGWKITMSSGVQIIVDRGWTPGVIDLHILGLGTDTYEGLCTATPTANPCDSECAAFKVDPSDNLFDFKESFTPPCREPYVKPSCKCHGVDSDYYLNMTCSSTDQSLNMLDTGYVCDNGISKIEKDDNKGDIFVDIDILNNIVFENGKTEWDSNYTFVWPTEVLQITEEHATQTCKAAFDKPLVTKICSQRQIDAVSKLVIDDCVKDIKISENLESANCLPKQVAQHCIYLFETSMVELTNGDHLDELSNLKNLLCSEECSDTATCIDNICVCNEGFMGSDCSARTDQPPSIMSVLQNPCDLPTKNEQCQFILVVAADFSEKHVSCKIRTLMQDDSPPSTDVNPPISGFVVTCRLPSVPTGPGVFLVSLSNDGQNYSEERKYIIQAGPECEEPE